MSEDASLRHTRGDRWCRGTHNVNSDRYTSTLQPWDNPCNTLLVNTKSAAWLLVYYEIQHQRLLKSQLGWQGWLFLFSLCLLCKQLRADNMESLAMVNFRSIKLNITYTKNYIWRIWVTYILIRSNLKL